MASKYPSLDERERAFRLKVMQMHRPNAFSAGDKNAADAILARVFDGLNRRFGTDAEIVTEDRVPPEKYLTYCTVLASFYEEVARLPPATASMALRGMLAPR
jgi:hypothetical protein